MSRSRPPTVSIRNVLLQIALGDWRDEAVSPAVDVGYVRAADLPVAESSAQGLDVASKIALFDEPVRPGSRDQFPFVDELRGAFDERDENVERSAAQ